MPTDIATYVIAQREGVKLHRYLDEPTLAKVAEYEGRLTAKEGGQAAPAPAKPAARRRAAKTSTVDRSKIPVGALSEQQFNDAERMAFAVYPLLYVFENSARAFVAGHLEAAYGKDWWDRPKLVSNPIRKVVERNKAASGKERWVERKTVHPIYLTELGNLADIITSEEGWKVFDPIFPRQSWVVEHFRTIEAPRNVVAHMNPLMKTNVTGIETRYQEWFDQIADRVPKT